MARIIPGVIARPGTSVARETGSWRTGKRPKFLREKCTGCNLCAMLCPEGVVFGNGKNTYRADLLYCKGCGICAQVCPVHDIEMETEAR